MKIREVIIRLCDWAICVFSFWVAFFLVFHKQLDNVDFFRMSILCLVSLGIHIVIFEISHIYRIIWRYVSGKNIIRGVICEFVSCIGALAFLYITNNIGKTLVVVAFAIEIVLWISSRMIYVILIRYISKKKGSGNVDSVSRKRTLILGGGDAASSLIETIQTSNNSLFQPVCILDDDKNKIGRYIANVKIVDSIANIKKVCIDYNIETVIFAIYDIDEEKKSEILNKCAELQIPVKILPHYASYVNQD